MTFVILLASFLIIYGLGAYVQALQNLVPGAGVCELDIPAVIYANNEIPISLNITHNKTEDAQCGVGMRSISFSDNFNISYDQLKPFNVRIAETPDSLNSVPYTINRYELDQIYSQAVDDQLVDPTMKWNSEDIYR